MNTITITRAESKMVLPKELFVAMENPEVITIVPESTDHFFLSKQSENLRDRLYHIKESLLSRVNNQHKKSSSAKLVSVENDRAIFTYDRSVGFQSSEYHIVNYHPGYYLMSTNPEPEHTSREKEWKGMKSYHEHLRLAAQDQNAKETSEWLVEKILKPFAPESVLEIGCGSGRNLHYVQKHIPKAKIFGIDINEDAINVANKEFNSPNASFAVASLYDLGRFKDGSIDVVFTSGVLMHVPHEKVEGVVREMHRIARRAVIHFELHGPSHSFDFHRYPRDYAELYKKMGASITSYEVYPKDDFRSLGTSSLNHALLVSKK